MARSMRWNAPAASLAWLDLYEGIVPGDQDRNDYARVERIARLASGTDITAWVYIYLKPVAPAHLISGGRWAPRSR